ncbi:MAG: pentapeptide repeat-containing protein [Cyanobacteria bacterium P01_D01_bin.36]
MRTLSSRSRINQVITVSFALLLAATPSLAEAPVGEPTPLRQNNARQLVLTNECAGCDLAGVILFEAHLIGADLRNADLTGANLTGSNLEGADLTGANLTGANFTRAFLTDTCLANTQLVDVNFTEAHLYNTDVQGANMVDLNLAGAEVFNTPISIGGDAPSEDELQPLEPIIPFEDTQPPVLHPEYLLDPIL